MDLGARLRSVYFVSSHSEIVADLFTQMIVTEHSCQNDVILIAQYMYTVSIHIRTHYRLYWFMI